MVGIYGIYKLGQILDWLKPDKSASDLLQEAEDAIDDAGTELSDSAKLTYYEEIVIHGTKGTDSYLEACNYVIQHGDANSDAYYVAQQYLTEVSDHEQAGNYDFRAQHLSWESSEAQAWEVVRWVRAHPDLVSQYARAEVERWVNDQYQQQYQEAHTEGHHDPHSGM